MTDTSPINLAVKRCADTLASVAAFQDWVGVSGEDALTQARARIHLHALPIKDDPLNGEYDVEQLNSLLPCAMVAADMEEPLSSRRIATNTFLDSGRLLVLFSRIINDYERFDSKWQVSTQEAVGNILVGLREKGDTAGQLRITEARISDISLGEVAEEASYGLIAEAQLSMGWSL